jgi:hypothetical protein
MKRTYGMPVFTAAVVVCIFLAPATSASTSTCAPALFERTGETVQAMNQSFTEEYLEFQKAIADHPELLDGESVVSTRTLLNDQVEQLASPRVRTSLLSNLRT